LTHRDATASTRQKLAAHGVALAVALGVAAIITWLSTIAFAGLPGDEISLATALAGISLTLAVSLLAGAIAFALGPLVGRGLAVGGASIYLFAAYLVNGYGDLVPGFDILRLGSVFYWTSGHRPLVGLEDWPAVGLVVALVAGISAVGVSVRGSPAFRRCRCWVEAWSSASTAPPWRVSGSSSAERCGRAGPGQPSQASR
jgi:hypothetical protein